MSSFKYKVLITTSGLGQRLGDITNYTNKALVRIGHKPAISYIIESYSKNVELVITLGHFGNHVKDFVRLVYPDRKVTFVDVDKYQGKGSSLGYSMLKARLKLQCPFIYHACDTIVDEKVPTPSINWIGGFRSSNSSNYASFNVVKKEVKDINDKGAIDFDYLHIGLVGISDFQGFWDSLFRLYKSNPNDTILNDSMAINQMLKNNGHFKVHEFNTWLDVGNVESLAHAKETAEDKFENLDKSGEAIYIFEKSVVKFHAREQIIKEKVKRARFLGSLVPKIEGSKQNFYKYRHAKGNLYSRMATPNDFAKFLNWCDKRLWLNKKAMSEKKFKEICRRFYEGKTRDRIKQTMKKNSLKDVEEIINGEKVPKLKQMLEKIDFSLLCNASQHQIHGDLILDNIIRTGRGYVLLDWRQNFGGSLEVGDIYYDFAKLNHNLTVNHDVINKNMFTIENGDSSIVCDIFRRENLVACQDILFDYIEKEGYDAKKVKLLTALVWLNMSALHHYPFNIFLYYFGKLNLWRAIRNQLASNKKPVIKNLVIDIDGVLTTGQMFYTSEGKVMKVFGPDDSDGLSLLKDKLNIHMISGDKRGFSITKKRIDDMKLPIDLVSTFERVSWIKKRYKLSETIYMGDGIFDALVFDKVVYSIAPANAFYKTKKKADFVTTSRGGEGAVAEACIHIMKKFFEPFNLNKHKFESGSGAWKK